MDYILNLNNKPLARKIIDKLARAAATAVVDASKQEKED